MFKRLFIAAAFAMACSPAFVSAQDFFFSFDEFSRQSSITIDASTTTTGQVFIFSDANLGFTLIDLDFTHDNSSVVAFTGATTTSTAFPSFTVLLTEDPNVNTNPPTPITETEGRLFGVALILPPPFFSSFPGIVAGDTTNPDFRDGANGFLLATVDFDIVGPGTANFDFALGYLGIQSNFGANTIDPDFAGSTATLTVVGVPEPVVIRGDASQDGDVDFSDVPFFISSLQSGIFQAESDCDGNGAVEFADIPVFISILQAQP